MPELVADGPTIPVHLLNELDSGRVVFFCGAGISAGPGSDLPGFGDLVDYVYGVNRMEPDAVEREALDLEERDAERRRPNLDKALYGPNDDTRERAHAFWRDNGGEWWDRRERSVAELRRWREALGTLPLAITLDTAHGPVGIVHALPCPGPWNETVRRCRDADDDAARARTLWGRLPVGEAEPARKRRRAPGEPRTIIAGHFASHAPPRERARRARRHRRGARPPVGAGDARLRERKGHHVPLEPGRGRARGGAGDGAGDRGANRPGAVARGRRRAGARTVVAHKDEVAGPANGSAQKKPAVRNAPTSTPCTASPTAAGLFAATRQIANGHRRTPNSVADEREAPA